MFTAQALARPARLLGTATTIRSAACLCSKTFSRTYSHTFSRTHSRTSYPSSSANTRFYSTTPALFKKYESHSQHNLHNDSKAAAKGVHARDLENGDSDHAKQESALLSGNDDLMVGNEGLEAIDPKDFPELYPREGDIEGLSQESHPDNERDFENLQGNTSSSSSSHMGTPGSVLLSDKERSDEEFSWFVDESFPEKSRTSTGGDDDKATLTDSDFVPLWQRNAQRGQDGKGHEEINLGAGHQDFVQDGSPVTITGLVQLLESERARNVKVIDMREKCDWTNWMVIAEGLSERHLGNVADQVYSALKKSSPKTSPPVMEGRDTSDWVVIDAGSVVIHFMTPESRKERDLEGLWASVKNPLKLKDAKDVSWEDVKGKMTKSWKESTGRSKGEDGKRGRRGERDIPLSEVVKW